MLTPEQAKLRVGRIGSSNIALLLGISPYGNLSPAKQRRNCYFDVMGLSPKKESSSMRDGIFFEPAIANYVEWKLGLPLTRHTQHIRQGFDWQIASLDAEGWCNPESGSYDRFIVEVKFVENPEYVAHWGRAGNTKPENVPDYVLAQMMHQLLVCGPDFTHAYAGCYRAGKGLGLYGPIARDEELICLIHEAEEKFYVDHILTKTPPVVAEESECSA